LTVVAVLPTPPFWFAIASVSPILYLTVAVRDGHRRVTTRISSTRCGGAQPSFGCFT
jgi:hypothetical protein